MSLWKKAVGIVATGALLATVLAPAALAVTGVGTAIKYNSDVDTRPADGLSYIALTFTADTAPATALRSISVTGGNFINGTGPFAPSATVTYPRTTLSTGAAIPATTQVWLASSVAGTATVTVQYSTGVAVTDSIQSFTFTGVTTTTPSADFSLTRVRADFAGGCNGASISSTPAITGNTDLCVRTTVRDTNNAVMSTGITVEWTISGPAFFNVVGFKATAAVTDAVNGYAYSPQIVGTGATGTAAITTTIKYLGQSVTLPVRNLNFVGAPASMTVTQNKFVGNDDGTVVQDVFAVVVKDAGGNEIRNGLTFTLASPTPANIWGLNAFEWNADKLVWELWLDCADTGVATAKIKVTDGAAKTFTSADAYTFTCSTALSSAFPGTFTISTTTTTVAPNGQLNVEVSVLDNNGQKAVDGTAVSAFTNGVGNVVPASGGANATTSNGVAKFLYLAPSNAGSATITVFVSNTVPNTRSVTIGIGQAVDQPLAVSVKAGLPSEGGTYGTATPVVAPGKYVTWKGQASAAYAGQVVGIYVAVKNADGTWGSFNRLTGRTIDSTGQALFWWRSSTPTWVSVRFGIESGTTALFSTARQARWR